MRHEPAIDLTERLALHDVKQLMFSVTIQARGGYQATEYANVPQYYMHRADFCLLQGASHQVNEFNIAGNTGVTEQLGANANRHSRSQQPTRARMHDGISI